MMLRPMRPKPLIPTLTAICELLRDEPRAKNLILVSGLPDGQTGGRTLINAKIRSPNSRVPAVQRRDRPLLHRARRRDFVYQAVRYRKYIGSLGQRLGVLPLSLNLDGDESIWIHAVSVGEVLTARALIGDLRERYPRLRLFRLDDDDDGAAGRAGICSDVDAVFFFPFDLGRSSSGARCGSSGRGCSS